MLNYKFPFNKIIVNFVKTKSEILVDNSTYLELGINTRQSNYVPLFTGQDLVLFEGEQKLEGKYFQDKTGKHFIKISDLSLLNNFDVEYTDIYYIESTSVNNKSNGFTTLSDVQSLKPELNNDERFLGYSGLIDSTILELINKVDVKTILPYEFQYLNFQGVNYQTIFNYKKEYVQNKEYQFIFGLTSHYFTVEYLVTVLNDKISVRQVKFDSLPETLNLAPEILIKRIISNNSKYYNFSVECKFQTFNNVSDTTIIYPYVISDKKDADKFTKDLGSEFLLTSAQKLIETTFDRYVLFADNSGIVNIPGQKINYLNKLDNINNTTRPGIYTFKYEANSSILDNLPKKTDGSNYDVSFRINVSELVPNIVKQQLDFIVDGKLKTYERYIDTNSSIVGVWREDYSTSNLIPISAIETTIQKQFVSQDQIDKWNRIENLSQSPVLPMVITKADLLTTNGNNNGSVRFVKTENQFYSFDAIDNAWYPVNNTDIQLLVSETNVGIKFIKNGTEVRTLNIPEVSLTNPGIVNQDVLRDYKQDFLNTLTFGTTGNASGNITRKFDQPLHFISFPENFNTTLKDSVLNIIYLNNENIDNRIDLTKDLSEIVVPTIHSKYSDNNILSGKVNKYYIPIMKVGSPDISLRFDYDSSWNIIINNKNQLSSSNGVNNYFTMDSVSSLLIIEVEYNLGQITNKRLTAYV